MTIIPGVKIVFGKQIHLKEILKNNKENRIVYNKKETSFKEVQLKWEF